MTQKLLQAIDNAMTEMGIEYQLYRYEKSPVVYPYVVGTYTESAPISESGQQDGVLILDGYNKGSLLRLEQLKDCLKTYFDMISGHIYTFDDGSTAAVWYQNAQYVPVWDAEMKHIVVNLTYKEWSVK